MDSDVARALVILSIVAALALVLLAIVFIVARKLKQKEVKRSRTRRASTTSLKLKTFRSGDNLKEKRSEDLRPSAEYFAVGSADDEEAQKDEASKKAQPDFRVHLAAAPAFHPAALPVYQPQERFLDDGLTPKLTPGSSPTFMHPALHRVSLEELGPKPPTRTSSFKRATVTTDSPAQKSRNNRLCNHLNHVSRDQAGRMIAGSRTLAHRAVVERLLPAYLDHVKDKGTAVEKSVYDKIPSAVDLLKRLMSCRPLAFYGRNDKTRLRNGATPAKPAKQWLKVGSKSEEKDIHLWAYLSYNEMQLSALVGASVPTVFVNAGARKNHGIPGVPGTFCPYGIYVGLVGPRFNGPKNCMESQYTLVTAEFSTEANGFGRNGIKSNPVEAERLAFLAELFVGASCSPKVSATAPPPKKPKTTSERPCFPSFSEVAKYVAENPESKEYLQLGPREFLNIQVYKNRVALTAQTLFLEADQRAREANDHGAEIWGVRCMDEVPAKKDGRTELVPLVADVPELASAPIAARVIVVGFGLGVWKRDASQTEYFLQAFRDVLATTPLPHVGEVVFSWIDDPAVTSLFPDEFVEGAAGKRIRIEFSKGNPADLPTEPLRLPDGSIRRRLLVASYAWDGNSLPGNEYWFGQMSGSGDSAAACCSLISELMNVEINPVVLENLEVVS
ncbi:hypothetical protein HDU96_010856 [Phlyctochytrium bullatum]|nr:hypothetical protein HDU96_010856 [Phlyctochytrium bullatum]